MLLKIFAAKVDGFGHTKGKRWSFRRKSGENSHFGTKSPVFRDEFRKNRGLFCTSAGEMKGDSILIWCYSVNLAYLITNLYGWLLKRFFVPNAYKEFPQIAVS